MSPKVTERRSQELSEEDEEEQRDIDIQDLQEGIQADDEDNDLMETERKNEAAQYYGQN